MKPYLSVFVVSMIVLIFRLDATVNASERAAASQSKCGKYEVFGLITMNGMELALKVNAGTQDEIELALPASFALKGYAYLKKYVKVVGFLDKPIRNRRGTFRPEELKDAFYDPLRINEGRKMHLIQERMCEK